MPKFKNYSAALVERQIKAIIRRNPENVNPRDKYGSCLYHEGRGANIRRCLIGQWAWEQGFETPLADDGPANELAKDMWSTEANFTDDAIDLLGEIQSRADGANPNGTAALDLPLAWKELISSQP